MPFFVYGGTRLGSHRNSFPPGYTRRGSHFFKGLDLTRPKSYLPQALEIRLNFDYANFTIDDVISILFYLKLHRKWFMDDFKTKLTSKI